MKILPFLKEPQYSAKGTPNTPPNIKDIKLRAEVLSYRPIAYTPFPPFVKENFTPVLNQMLKKLFRANRSIEENILDEHISNIFRQAAGHMRKQYIDHMDAIGKINLKSQGDHTVLKKQLEYLQQELSKNEEKQTKIKARLDKNTFVEGEK